MSQDGLSETLRRMLVGATARRPAATPMTVRGFDSLVERAPIPEDVRAYVAQKTGAAPAQPNVDAELVRAQESDARNGAFSHVGSRLDDAARTIAGLPQAMNRPGGDGDANVSALTQQRAGASALKSAAAKGALSRPDSPESVRFRATVARTLPGIYSPEELAQLTAADRDDVLEFGKLRESLAQRRAEAAARDAAAKAADADRDENRQLNAQLRREQIAQSGENARTMVGMRRESLDLHKAEAEREAAKAEKTAKGPMLPASEALGFGGIDAATQMLDELTETRRKKTGALSGVTQYLPGTDAGEYADAQKAAAQTVGLILEGGKLAEGDLSRYMAMIPSAGDSDERAQAKVENIKRMLVLKKAATLNALKTAGFNTGNLSAEVQTGKPAGGNVDLAATVRVSNGSETLEIDPSDLAAAEADGYKRVAP